MCQGPLVAISVHYLVVSCPRAVGPTTLSLQMSVFWNLLTKISIQNLNFHAQKKIHKILTYVSFLEPDCFYKLYAKLHETTK